MTLGGKGILELIFLVGMMLDGCGAERRRWQATPDESMCPIEFRGTSEVGQCALEQVQSEECDIAAAFILGACSDEEFPLRELQISFFGEAGEGGLHGVRITHLLGTQTMTTSVAWERPRGAPEEAARGLIRRIDLSAVRTEIIWQLLNEDEEPW